MNCEECQALMLDLLEPDAADPAVADARAHADACDDCAAELATLRQGALLAAALPMMEAPAGASVRIMAAARTKLGRSEEPAPPEPADETPTALQRLWERLASFASGPQVAMATIMLLVVVFSAWYVPPREGEPRATSPMVLQPDPESTTAPATAPPADPAPAASPTTAEESDQRAEADDTGNRDARTTSPRPALADATNTRTGETEQGGEAAADPEPEPTTEDVEQSREAPAPAERLARGVEAYDRNDYRAAIDELDAVVSAPGLSRSMMPTALHHLARSYKANGDCNHAVRRYRQLFRSHPTYPQIGAAMVEAGACYRQLRQYTEARRVLELAAEQPGSAAAASDELARLRRAEARRQVQMRRAPAGMRPATMSTRSPAMRRNADRLYDTY